MNFWTGCTQVSPGCNNCYAETLCNRFPHLGEWGVGAERKLTGEQNRNKPHRWNRKAPTMCACGHSEHRHARGARRILAR